MATYNIFEMTERQVIELIESKTTFKLYGKFRKEEKKKLVALFEGNDYEMGLQTDRDTGNRELWIRIYNPDPDPDEGDIMYKTFYYQY